MLPDGTCRNCDRENQAKYHERRKLAMVLLRDIESRGIHVSDIRPGDGFTIALEWASAINDRELRRIEREHPGVITKLRNRIDHIVAG
jgi:DNA-binding transcriptional MocR family regulator